MGALGNIEEAEKYFGLSLQRLEDLQDLPEQLKSAFINQVYLSGAESYLPISCYDSLFN